ncbi:g1681 [Coccomyxa viridis]|uniref:G1681 protein n=1 Tax=Coccomyxa viridis TaxID=1274662 RepID=A0ABP1FQG0_9CHLO
MSPVGARGGSHAGDDALAFEHQSQPNETLKPAHLAKRKQRNKALEITFNPEEHREFVTGFHKRKLQRRKDAQRILDEKAKKQRLEERAQKRADLKKRLDLDRYMTSSEESGGEDEKVQKPRDVRAFANNGMRATVTVKPFSIHTDSEDDEEAKAAAAAAPQENRVEVPKDPQPDSKPKAKQKGTFSSLLSKQNMHRKGSSGKSSAVKGAKHSKKKRKR